MAHSYISARGNLVGSVPLSVLSAHHQVGLSLTVSEVEDVVRLSLSGPSSKYFAVGFGSNSMAGTYALVVAGQQPDGQVRLLEQVLADHAKGYALQPSWVVEEYTVSHSKNKATVQLTLSRRLSTALEMDEYWLFSCAEPQLALIWSTGKHTAFERHVAFGEDTLALELHEQKGYDKNQAALPKSDFKLRLNWTGIFVALCIGAAAFFGLVAIAMRH